LEALGSSRQPNPPKALAGPVKDGLVISATTKFYGIKDQKREKWLLLLLFFLFFLKPSSSCIPS